ncbi:MAG: hypothetical protein SWX82_10145 [Cyanobacteriota bacterium]|nr:hypothetical protein [Cyanobacteriota bacterium]
MGLIKYWALVKCVYDINLNHLGGPPQEDLLRSQPTPNPDRGEPTPNPSQEGKKEEERVVEGESFLFALLSGQDIIPLFTNAEY